MVPTTVRVIFSSESLFARRLEEAGSEVELFLILDGDILAVEELLVKMGATKLDSSNPIVFLCKETKRARSFLLLDVGESALIQLVLLVLGTVLALIGEDWVCWILPLLDWKSICLEEGEVAFGFATGEGDVLVFGRDDPFMGNLNFTVVAGGVSCLSALSKFLIKPKPGLKVAILSLAASDFFLIFV